jgi:IBR domain, a half RING-finger domain
MTSTPKMPSLADLQQPDALPEFSDRQYARDVLCLENTTEETFDEELSKEAAALGIEIPGIVSEIREGHVSLCDSTATVTSRLTRAGSTESQESTSTGATSRSQTRQPPANSTSISQKQSRGQRFLSFSEYEKFLAQADAQSPDGLGVCAIPSEPALSILSLSTRKSYKSVKDGVKSRLKFRKDRVSTDGPKYVLGDVRDIALINGSFCICCRDEFKRNKALHVLTCSHKYCEKCLRVLIQQATADESKMPPKCCNKPIPGSVVKSVLTRDEQQRFMKSVLQFSTPWGERIFCPNLECSEFIPKRNKVDPKHPFKVICRKCRTKACSICKRGAHRLGQDCPADWELDAVLQMGENQGWRRCYKCRNLVELTQGCTHITCRCKAQFCYICGAVWDPLVGCPNFCNGEEELERRRQEEEARAAMEAAEKAAQEAAEAARAAEQLEAIKRSQHNGELINLHARQVNERDRFDSFERKMKWSMWTRHGQLKLDLLDRYGDLQSKMVERHAKTTAHLEDRQVAAEMELRASLKQSERSVQIRLRHMEAYCDELGYSSDGLNPARVVTERDLRELGQQYNLRDGLERLHQSRINVMREKQSKKMEQLLSRQEEEVEKLMQKQAEELDAQEEIFGAEEEKFMRLFRERRQRLKQRWVLVDEMTRKMLEKDTGLKFAKLPELDWPDPETVVDLSLEALRE